MSEVQRGHCLNLYWLMVSKWCREVSTYLWQFRKEFMMRIESSNAPILSLHADAAEFSGVEFCFSSLPMLVIRSSRASGLRDLLRSAAGGLCATLHA